MSNHTDRRRVRYADEEVTQGQMSDLRQEDVIGIFCADIHLTIQAPVWRSVEPDWMAAQTRPLKELADLQYKFKCPVFCAGDIFDTAKSLPEVINFATDNIPDNMYAIPGQHDLPEHQIEQIHKSAFQSLLNTGAVISIDYRVNIISDCMIVPFQFGEKLTEAPESAKFKIAIVHEYKWIEGFSFPGAPEASKIGKRREIITKHNNPAIIAECTKKFNKASGLSNSGFDRNNKYYSYDLIVYGDNHKGFQTKIGNTIIFNCGTLMRRKSDEINYKPQVGLLTKDFNMIPYYLNTSKDKYLEVKTEEPEKNLDMSQIITELRKLGKSKLDFADAVEMYIKAGKASERVIKILYKAMKEKS